MLVKMKTCKIEQCGDKSFIMARRSFKKRITSNLIYLKMGQNLKIR